MRRTRAAIWVICPICETGYAVPFKRAGARCGDLSQGQVRRCVGRLIPEDQYRAAEWRGRTRAKWGEPRANAGLGRAGQARQG